MWLNAFTTCDSGRCSCSSEADVVSCVVDPGEVAVALRVVVVRVDDDLARERCDRDVLVGLERHRDHDEVAARAAPSARVGLCVLGRVRRPGRSASPVRGSC